MIETMTLPTGYRGRPITPGDLPALLAVAEAWDVAIWGEPGATDGFVRDMVGLPELDLDGDSLLIGSDRGDPVAFAWLLARDGGRLLDTDGFVHPGHTGRGLGSALLDFLEARADAHASTATAPETLLRAGIGEPDRDAAALLLTRGYALVRHFWEMAIDPGAAPLAEPAVPQGIVVRTFRRERDARRLHPAIGDAFSEHWGFVPRSFEVWEGHRLEAEGFDPSLWWVAWAGDPGAEGSEVAGFALTAVEGERGFVGTLGVRKPWRGKGLATALLLLAFGEFARRGFREVALEVDAGNATGATELYRKVGMHVVRQFDTYEKRLR